MSPRYDDPEERLSSSFHDISERSVEEVYQESLRSCGFHPLRRDALHWLEWKIGRSLMRGEPQSARDDMACRWRTINDVHQTDLLVSTSNNVGVYIIGAEPGEMVKIGWSENISRRIRQLQTGNAARLFTLVCLDATQEHEFALHRRFSALRVDGSEWFRMHPALKRYVESRTPHQVNGGLRF